MALMLRKAAEPVLQAADLDPYHADLDADSKAFKLYTPCGKTFATVTGVLFSSLKPTKDEIVYAIELLEFWLLRNKELIDTYIDAFTKLQAYTDMPLKKGDMKISLHTPYNRDGPSATTVDDIDIEHEGFTFTLDAKGGLTSVTWKDSIPIPVSINLPTAKHTAAIEFMALHSARLKQQSIVNHILIMMNTCEV
jgi:hypothetical protein